MVAKRFGTVGAIVAGAAVTGTVLTMVITNVATAAPGDTIGPFNPVRDPLGQLIDGHMANSGFSVFVENDVQLNADESEGTIALGGDLLFASSYNVFSAVPETFTVPGDAQPVFLYVGGGVQWTGGPFVLSVLQNGYAKVADTSTYDALNTDSNGASVNFRIVQPGAGY